MNQNLEKDWVTKAGLRAIVISHPFGHRCGYVGVSKSNGLFAIDYSGIFDQIGVHGGLTFSDYFLSISNDLWWFGYDCSHSNDYSKLNPGGVKRTLEYCIEECEHLASQLVDTPLEYLYRAKKTGKLPEELHNKMIAWGVSDPNPNIEEYFELIKND